MAKITLFSSVIAPVFIKKSYAHVSNFKVSPAPLLMVGINILYTNDMLFLTVRVHIDCRAYI